MREIPMKDAETMVLPRLGPAAVSVEDPWGEDEGADPVGPPTDPQRWRVAAWLVPALLMGLLGVVRAGAPGLRTEELATWGRAASSWRDNWSMLGSDDVAVGPYHLLMRAWAAGFGTSDLALRVPSILAMTAAAALVGALAARLFAPGTGVLAGVVFALLPTSARYAQEAQPYALTLLAAVLATSLLVAAIDRPRHWRFAGYAGAVVVLGLCNVVALLLLVGHGWAVFAFRRTVAVRWLAAASVGALPVAALLWFATRHGAQIGPASHPSLTALAATPRELFGVTALGAVLLALALFSLPLRHSAAIYTAWAVVPPLVLLLIAQATPFWRPQYLLFTLPAWATLGAVALARAGTRWSVGVLAAVALIVAPAQLAVREPDGHQQATRQLAEIIQPRLQPGDGVVYGSSDSGGGGVGRNVVAHYLPADRRPKDLLATAPHRVDGRLPVSECADVARCLHGARRLWVVRLGEQPDPVHGIGGAKEQLLRKTYQVAQVWRPTGLTLALLVDERTDL
ncbi:glycosyltransferase family 39 protein [Micromonospora sp. 4G57]|uniref:Glycosyltransferase family 39 protein n=1 Tax=Micromonospora sicca TaxID=2202420 RepID=A0ABU5JF05_9ACTN|nr:MULTISPECIES: glycosyltransferase family 39 protein [unclassified Micromonospora]MDZ5445421.1 glycosyltransferase family 39 protein [Micromonospora sp. 4G57]MDZ5491170.1 glycosyltransferase family 39 protein [Micromonospora sp. 4G53]